MKLNKRPKILSQFTTSVEEKFVDVPQMPIEDFLTLKNGPTPPLLVDIRSPEEQNVSMIPGAISQRTFEERLTSEKEQILEKKIVTYCAIGFRSSTYARKLIKKGFKAFNLRECVFAWAFHGLPFEREGHQQTYQLRVPNQDWDVLPPEYEALYD